MIYRITAPKRDDIGYSLCLDFVEVGAIETVVWSACTYVDRLVATKRKTCAIVFFRRACVCVCRTINMRRRHLLNDQIISTAGRERSEPGFRMVHLQPSAYTHNHPVLLDPQTRKHVLRKSTHRYLSAYLSFFCEKLSVVARARPPPLADGGKVEEGVGSGGGLWRDTPETFGGVVDPQSIGPFCIQCLEFIANVVACSSYREDVLQKVGRLTVSVPEFIEVLILLFRPLY